MTDAGNRGELGVRDPFVIGFAMREGNITIALAPEDQRRQAGSVEIAQQSRIVGKLPGKARQRAPAKNRADDRVGFGRIGKRFHRQRRIRIGKQCLPQRSAVET